MEQCREENDIEFGPGQSDDPQVQAEREDRRRAAARWRCTVTGIAERVRGWTNRWTIIGAIIVVGAAAVVVWLVIPQSNGRDDERDVSALSTTEVTRSNLAESESFDGTLTFEGSRGIAPAAAGTVTGVTAEGAVVEEGGTFFTVDTEPVILLYGNVPAWRDLDTSASGDDVLQLEEALVRLGFADEGDINVDDDYTSSTASVVEKLQEAVGMDDTGELKLGQVVFLPSPQRIAAADLQAGDSASPGQPVVTVTGVGREVVAEVPPEDIDLFAVEAPVTVELPDGTEVPGRVIEIGQVVTTSSGQEAGSGDGYQEVKVALDDPAAAGSLVEAPVTVKVTKTVAEDVLAVPVQALLALSEGGYAVEVVNGETTTLVGVETGSFADDLVEISPTTGSLEAGQLVVISG